MSQILFEVTRFNENNVDFITIKALKSDFDETAKIDIQWNELPSGKRDLAEFMKNVKQALSDAIHNTLNVKKETRKESVITIISDNINSDLPGTLDDQTIFDLRQRIEI